MHIKNDQDSVSGNLTVTLTVPNLSDELAKELSDWLAKNLSWAYPWMGHSLSVEHGQTLTERVKAIEDKIAPYVVIKGNVCARYTRNLTADDF